MQDARISACLTDTVARRLQDYITEYRTNKARQDFLFQEKLFARKSRNMRWLKIIMPSLLMQTRILSC